MNVQAIITLTGDMNLFFGGIKSEIEAFAGFIPMIAELEGAEFQREFHARLNRIDEMSMTVPARRDELMRLCFDLCADELDKSLMQNHSRNKPVGYAGDYMLIDYIYTNKTHDDGSLWDEFFHRQDAPIAVRNRKDYFIEQFTRQCAARPGGMSLLNIASGPCRDIAEALERIDSETLHIHCVDSDKNAVAYAQGLVREHSAKFTWQVGNVFRIRPTGQYDMVWSAGLFDYLDERYASALARRMWSWTRPGGRMIIGNFHPRNPSRNYMEWTGAWFLIHRTEADMLRFMEAAGIPGRCVTFEREPLGVNIFCVADKE